MQLYPDTAAPLDLEVPTPTAVILVQVHLEVPYLSRYKCTSEGLLYSCTCTKLSRHRRDTLKGYCTACTCIIWTKFSTKFSTAIAQLYYVRYTKGRV